MVAPDDIGRGLLCLLTLLAVGLLWPSLPAAVPDAGADASTQADADTSDAGADAPPLTRSYEPEGPPRDERREPPEIDGVDEPDRDAVDYLLLAPRTLLFPVYLVTEYGIRWPVGQLIVLVERENVVEKTVDLLTFADGDAGFLPVLDINTGEADSYGARFFYRPSDYPGLRFGLSASGNPGRNLHLQTLLEVPLGLGSSRITSRVGFDHVDDAPFFGVGVDTNPQLESDFAERSLAGRVGWRLGTDADPAGATMSVGLLDRRIGCTDRGDEDICGPDGRFGTDDDVLSADAPGVAPLDRDYGLAHFDWRGFWDSRRAEAGPDPGLPFLEAEVSDGSFGETAYGLGLHRLPSQTGIRLEGFGRLGFGLDGEVSVIRYGAEIAGFWDIFGSWRRTLGLRLRAEAADPLAGDRVPVSELTTLGGIETHRGFRRETFRGRSSLLATLDYRYPVWSFMQGNLFIDVGNVFGPHWEGLHADRLRSSFGLGFHSVELLDRHTSYDLNLAVGTAPFGEGFELVNVRVNLGLNWGF